LASIAGAAISVASTFGKQSCLFESSQSMSSTGNDNVRPTASPGGADEDRSNERSNKTKKKKKSFTLASSGFTGKCEDIKDHIYDVTPGKSGFDAFAKTTREIGEYIARTVKDAGEFRTAMDPENLGFSPLVPPADPTDVGNLLLLKRWELAFKTYHDALERRNKATSQAFAIVLGQCSPTVIDRIKASNQWNVISDANDLVGLLQLIRTSMYTGATSKNSLHSLIEAQAKFHAFRQSSRMTNADYLHTFKGLVDAIEHLDGDLGVDSAIISRRIQADGLDPEDTAQWEATRTTVREEYMAMQLLLKADVKRYGALIAITQNDFVSGQDKYPKELSKAYDVLVNYVDPAKHIQGLHGQEGGMSFYQDDMQGRGGRGRGGRGRGGRGRGRGDVPAATADDNHHTEEQAQEIGRSSNDSTQEHDYYDSSFNMCAAENFVLQHNDLPRRWLLLDSCSTTDIVANVDLLSDVHQAATPTWVRCNAGRVQLTQQGYLGDYPYPVWYNPKGVANILSLSNVAEHYRVTMDTSQSKAMVVHRLDGTTIPFTPSVNGLYKYEMRPAESINHMWSLLTTVASQSLNYTKRAYKKAVLARKLQNIIMRPSARQYGDVIVDYLRDCPVTKADIRAAEAIFGPNLGSLKGKTVRHPTEHVAIGIDPVPVEVLEQFNKVTLVIDIMFINKVPFFITTSRGIQFGTVEALPNRQVPTVKDALRKVVELYRSRGLIVEVILADNEFEPLRPWFPMLNTCAANEHVPDVERFVRTVKDRTRSMYRMLPYKYLPRLVLIHLVKNAVFWLNAFPGNDGITRKYSPRYIMTGQHLSAKKHAVIEFGAYVQTHEQHTNNMDQRSMGCICLGPTGNQQGAHWFMSLSSGERVVRYRWTELPIPKEAIDRVSAIGRQQRMPSTLTYANRLGREIGDTAATYPSDEDTDSDDDTYEDSQQSDSDEDSDSEDDDDDDDDDSDDDDDNDDDNEINTDGYARPVRPRQHQEPLIVIERNEDDLQKNQGVRNPGANAADPPPDDSSVDDDSTNSDDSQASANRPTEHDRFRAAEADGVTRASQPDAPRPTRNVQRRIDEDYVYLNLIHHALERTPGLEHALVTAQMSAKAGLKAFGNQGAEALMKELRQLILMNVIAGCKSHEMTHEQKNKALRYLMFLKEKRCGRIKARGCADGRKQRVYKTKADTSSPTVSIEALLLSCMIDSLEGRDVATCDIPGAFMQADIDEEVHVKFDGELVDLLVQVDQSLAKYVTMERGKKVLYTRLNKALYGTVQASLLFWKRLSTFLIDVHGFERNPYDWCVVNKTINGKQCTIVWYVDDLKLSHVDASVVDQIVALLNAEFGKNMDLTIRRGKIHDYFGIQFDFSTKGKVAMTMHDYITELIKECPDDLMKGPSTTPAAAHLFSINPACAKLDDESAILYHHLTAKLLYLSKRARPDLQLAVSFLSTRVLAPDLDDWKKLGRCVRYLRDSAQLAHTLEADGTGIVRWWVDASYGVHHDMRSHTGAAMSMGKGCVYSISRRQRLNTRSSTEAELVGVNDAMNMILWTRLFLEGQGYKISDNVLYQDNQSAILLEQNGKMSSSKRTRHLEIRYFFVTDNVAKKHLRIEYCPTDDMVADFFTKPLQGSKFQRFRAIILNLPAVIAEPSVIDSTRKECVGTGPAVTGNLVTPGSLDDEVDSQTSASWVEVIRRKRKHVHVDKGKRSEIQLLTLFTKRK
jgi:hypothetical protein